MRAEKYTKIAQFYTKEKNQCSTALCYTMRTKWEASQYSGTQ